MREKSTKSGNKLSKARSIIESENDRQSQHLESLKETRL